MSFSVFFFFSFTQSFNQPVDSGHITIPTPLFWHACQPTAVRAYLAHRSSRRYACQFMADRDDLTHRNSEYLPPSCSSVCFKQASYNSGRSCIHPLASSSEVWDYRCAPSYPAQVVFVFFFFLSEISAAATESTINWWNPITNPVTSSCLHHQPLKETT